MAQYGIYRGMVLNTLDPSAGGRVQVRIPAVFGAENAWAAVCVPFGVTAAGAAPVGAQVWVAFEAGDPSRPVVLGTVRTR